MAARWSAGFAIATLLIAGCATDENISGKHWAGGPTPGIEYVPPAAAALGQESWVVLSCVMAEGRRAEGCKVAQEYPKNWEYGDAALRLREGIVITEDEAVAVGESFRLPVAFCMPGAGSCEIEAIRQRLIAHRVRLGPMFPGEEPIPEYNDIEE